MSAAAGLPPTIDELAIADAPAAWRAAGFDVDGDVCLVGTVRLRLEGPGRGRGIVGWSVRGLGAGTLDGLPTTLSTRPPAAGHEHQNGVMSIDHLVAMTPDLDRTTATLRDAGLDLRRIREQPTPGGAPRQAFFRLGEVILEVVQAPAGTRIASDADGPARLWGISFAVRDLDATAAVLGDLLGSVRDAVQPGRRIGTLRREAGLGPAIAFMSPRAPETE
jgi:catechol 2,3-dioxygenase-like lactoylglutathione lyase family enzyme